MRRRSFNPSSTLNTDGTNSSDSAVDNNSPPITAIAMGARNSPPVLVPSADGTIPAAMAMVVMTIGRARLWPASIIAVARSMPPLTPSSANSTSMIAFLVTIPISIRNPITTDSPIPDP